MAYISQDRKKVIAKNVKAVAKAYGFGGRDVTVAVRHYSSLVVNIWGGPLDLLGDSGVSGDYLQINPYWCEEHAEDPKIKQFYTDLLAAIKSTGYYNNSDAMSDYFDHDFYIDINAGRFDKPYKYSGDMKAAA